jgi:hypothetical protein
MIDSIDEDKGKDTIKLFLSGDKYSSIFNDKSNFKLQGRITPPDMGIFATGKMIPPSSSQCLSNPPMEEKMEIPLAPSIPIAPTMPQMAP